MAADNSDYPARKYGASAPTPGAEGVQVSNISRGQKFVNIAGALGSVALVASLGWWGWELAVRDVRGVPVVRALEGPMRITPVDPGGAVVDYQGLAVNGVAAKDGAQPSDRVVLAPAPVELTLEDVPGLAGSEPSATEALASLPEQPAPPAEPEVPLSQEDAVAAALAEALAETPAAPGATDLPPGAIARSLRPKLRPSALAANAAAAGDGASAVALGPPVEIDPATLQPGVRLVQFGAYDTPEIAKAEWSKIAGRLGALMAGKAMVIEAAESGGLTFWRLRGHGFEGEDDSRRFCSAAVAEGVNCIPVTQR